ncbi:MAG: hypothetical protein J5U19_08910, partial [Candidatus Methanoperedens sp.]|nr:hypothetical protein [Candidatus Methanoperedens sp.]
IFTTKANVVTPIESHIMADTKGESALTMMMSQLESTIKPLPPVTPTPTPTPASNRDSRKKHRVGSQTR